MYLTRLSLKRSPEFDALAQILDPGHSGRRADAHHRLIWSAFAGDTSAKRDFLWRAMGQGRFLVLSPEPPRESALFEPPEAAEFAPALASGDRLAILLRANAARTVTEADGRKRHRDVVMEALKPVPNGERASVRMDLAQAAGRVWLEGQGARAGFAVEDAGVSAYRVVETRKRGPRFGVIDLEGMITVTDPAAFLSRLAKGFGRAKAFGCGLMLIRRV
ncbi:type I-E CRISPR-associated protein Cas6/Cse3/CasE [Pararhodobacter sp. SW119]|uniref:type I-E CRISPR-associated protein Cas6/Cse3/CasE n=1 Tax=Pararhodobacter sp. SW119 TaxID=2780075 RepID=UPI001FD7DFF3|nr:type I-E CRISPR-associated protein Cas6/Cse3/CasE [Pararhodobacter sp. SW119]